MTLRLLRVIIKYYKLSLVPDILLCLLETRNFYWQSSCTIIKFFPPEFLSMHDSSRIYRHALHSTWYLCTDARSVHVRSKNFNHYTYAHSYILAKVPSKCAYIANCKPKPFLTYFWLLLILISCSSNVLTIEIIDSQEKHVRRNTMQNHGPTVLLNPTSIDRSCASTTTCTV